VSAQDYREGKIDRDAFIDENVGMAVNAPQGTIIINTLPTLRATPPAPPPHFTGREADLAKLASMLTSGGSIAITALHGMGGIGKTALASKLAERIADQYPGGVLWWSLGPSPDVITALDVWTRHADPQADLSSLPDANSRAQLVRSMLAMLGKLCFIIDDVWDKDSAQTLLSAVPPGCPIVITTRDGDLAKELRCRIERIDTLPEDEAIALLAILLGPLNHYESAAKEIAALTEGLPLALELIAGIADSPADLPALAKKLHDRPSLDILKLPGDEKREKSVEACLAMSYRALDADMQRRFRLLGVFAPAPFDRDAIAAVWDEADADVVDNAIHFLTRRNLLTRVILSAEGTKDLADDANSSSNAETLRAAQGDNTVEYRQHALLRAYAFALLNPHPAPPPSMEKHINKGGNNAAPSPVRGSTENNENAKHEQRTGEGWDGGSRHAAYYRRFAEEEDWRAIEHTFDQIDWGWQWVQANATDQIINYVFAVESFLDIRGRKLEVINWYKIALAQSRNIKDRKREGVFLNNLGGVYSDLGQPDTSLDFYQQALSIQREVSDRSGEGATLNNLSLVYDALGQKDKALDFYQQALAITREVGDRSGEGTTLNNIGRVYDALGQKDKALDFYQQALAITREVGDRSREGAMLNNLGLMYNAIGQQDKALDFFQQALVIGREVGDRSGEGTTLNNLGLVYNALGQPDKALDFFQQALMIHREVGNRYVEGATQANIGALFAQTDRLAEAEQAIREAVAILTEVKSPNSANAQRWLDDVRKKLGKT
jgi:tetratricopeptide (TPR) repeat protein